ncbi:MAG: DUF3868 domain-containing protein, partial [Muribaculaceae bacterium]|nr:DUF3868 domain-containing protein [Muribaculaceae bacterium]
MKKLFAILALGLTAYTAAADGNIAIKSVDVARNGSQIDLKMSLDASNLKLDKNKELIYTPMIVNENDTLRMPSFTVAGRNRWYGHLRNDKAYDPSLYRSGEITAPIDYSYSATFADW